MKKNIIFWLLLIFMLAGVWGYRHYQETQLVGKITNETSAAAKSPEQQSQASTAKQGLPKSEVQKAPNFKLQDVSGKTVSLQDFRGKVVLLNFWTTWCPYCKVEMPEIDKTFQQYKDKGLVILAVDITAEEKNTESVKDFIVQKGYHFEVLMDKQGEVSQQYAISSIPTSFIINQQGEIVDAKIGPFIPMELEQKIKGLLK